MPVQPPAKEVEEMEVEPDSALEANGEEEEEEEESEGHSLSELESEAEEESSEMDDEDCERRRVECLDEMSDLEKQFLDLKEKLFRERLAQVRVKLEEVMSGKASEYQGPLSALHTNMRLRTEVAGVYRELCLQVLKHKYDCEIQGARQHLESEKLLLQDSMRGELLEKIQRLEEDRQSCDITSEWWGSELRGKKTKRKSELSHTGSKKQKTTLVSGPYIVYMLRETDILEDWTAIKKAKAAVLPLKKKSEAPVKADRGQYSARCADGTLYYEGESYCKGNSILLDIREEAPSQAVITAVSTGEVWLRRTDGSKTKIYVSQLQKGKYTIRRA